MTRAASGPDPELLALLVCPLTRAPMRYDAKRAELVSEAAGLAYPIREGVPVLLVDEARRIEGLGDGPEKSDRPKP